MNHKYRKLSPAIGLVELSFTNDQILLDIRTKDEFEQTPIFENATHLDVLDISFREKIKDMDKIRPYLIICQTGKRGKMACEIMVEMGFMNLAYIDGGKQAWDAYFLEKGNK